MNKLAKTSTVPAKLARVDQAPPEKFFKGSNFRHFILDSSGGKRDQLKPLIDRAGWSFESAGGTPTASTTFAGIGIVGIVTGALHVWVAGPHSPIYGTDPNVLIVLGGSVMTSLGGLGVWRHAGRIRWVKEASARRIRAWLSITYGLHVPEISPDAANRFLNKAEIGDTLPLVDEVGRQFLLYRVTDGKYIVRDGEREVLAQLPSAKADAAPLRPGADPSAKRLPRATRAVFEWAGVLHSTLAAKAGLSPEHEHRVTRAGEVLAEVAQMTADLPKSPSPAYVKNIDSALHAIIKDMEAIKDEIEAALNRQAEVLAIYTREVTAKRAGR